MKVNERKYVLIKYIINVVFSRRYAGELLVKNRKVGILFLKHYFDM